jgi:heat shock protein HslJ
MLLAGLAMAGCASAPEPPPLVPALAGTSWKLESIDGAPPAPGSHATLELAADGRASGDASCNRFTGTWSQSTSALTFGRMASTRRACPPPLGDQERRFLKALEAAARYRLDGQRLLIDGAGGRLAFVSRFWLGRDVVFDCENGDRITVAFTQGLARLTDAQGRVHELRQLRAASGIWYEGGGQSLRGKGPEITWKAGRGAGLMCREAG